MNHDLIFKEEAYAIIGRCMEVHRFLGHGFLEIVYKDALEYEFKSIGTRFSREQRFEVPYKAVILPHHFYADFTVYGKIILEVKCMDGLHDDLYAQTINYLQVSKYRLGLLVNFGRRSLEYKRVIL